jgi:hypothetical protein
MLIDGDLIRWTESFISDRTMEIVCDGNVLQSHPVEAGMPKRSPMSPVLFPKHSTGPILSVEDRVQAVKGLCISNDLGWIATGKDENQMVKKLEGCAAESIEWASRRDIEFHTAKTDTALFTCRRDYKKYLRTKLTAEIQVGESFVWYNKEATQWLVACMDAHLTFKSITTVVCRGPAQQNPDFPY